MILLSSYAVLALLSSPATGVSFCYHVTAVMAFYYVSCFHATTCLANFDVIAVISCYYGPVVIFCHHLQGQEASKQWLPGL